MDPDAVRGADRRPRFEGPGTHSGPPHAEHAVVAGQPGRRTIGMIGMDQQGGPGRRGPTRKPGRQLGPGERCLLEIFAGRARLKGLVVAPATSVAATFEFRDGGATGPILFQMDIPSNTNANSYSITVPGEGILYNNSIYLTLSVGSVTGITAFYG